MNFAWANPIDGIREQTLQSSPERMLAEAKRRVWEELQLKATLPPNWTCSCQSESECLIHASAPETIFRQEPIGKVTLSRSYVCYPDRVREFDNTAPDYSFAWCSPSDGRRITSSVFPGQELVEELKQLDACHEHVPEVTVYAQWPECTVSQDGPEPPKPEPEDIVTHHGIGLHDPDPPAAGAQVETDPGNIAERKAMILGIACYDDATKI